MSKAVGITRTDVWMQNERYEITIKTNHGQKIVSVTPDSLMSWINELDMYVINMRPIRHWSHNSDTLGYYIYCDYQIHDDEYATEYSIIHYAQNGARHRCKVQYEDS